MQTQAQKTVYFIFNLIKDTLQDVGEYGLPSGQLYAVFSQYGLSLQNYEAIISGLIDLKQIRQENNRLYWNA